MLTKREKLGFCAMAVLALGIAGLDQFTKALTVAKIPLYGKAPLLPGILELTHVQNFGAAFSSLQGMRWLFLAVFLVLTGLIFWERFRKPLPFTTLDRWLIACIYGGGLGNMIDRVRLGYVVDMIHTEFMEFPVFNVADCFISCGCILLILHLLIFNRDFWKEEKK